MPVMAAAVLPQRVGPISATLLRRPGGVARCQRRIRCVLLESSVATRRPPTRPRMNRPATGRRMRSGASSAGRASRADASTPRRVRLRPLTRERGAPPRPRRRSRRSRRSRSQPNRGSDRADPGRPVGATSAPASRRGRAPNRGAKRHRRGHVQGMAGGDDGREFGARPQDRRHGDAEGNEGTAQLRGLLGFGHGSRSSLLSSSPLDCIEGSCEATSWGTWAFRSRLRARRHRSCIAA